MVWQQAGVKFEEIRWTERKLDFCTSPWLCIQTVTGFLDNHGSFQRGLVPVNCSMLCFLARGDVATSWWAVETSDVPYILKAPSHQTDQRTSCNKDRLLRCVLSTAVRPKIAPRKQQQWSTGSYVLRLRQGKSLSTDTQTVDMIKQLFLNRHSLIQPLLTDYMSDKQKNKVEPR